MDSIVKVENISINSNMPEPFEIEAHYTHSETKQDNDDYFKRVATRRFLYYY
jgi:hypothetical protein